MSGTRAAELRRIEDGIMHDIADCKIRLKQLRRERIAVWLGRLYLWLNPKAGSPGDQMKLDLPEAA